MNTPPFHHPLRYAIAILLASVILAIMLLIPQDPIQKQSSTPDPDPIEGSP